MGQGSIGLLQARFFIQVKEAKVATFASLTSRKNRA